MTQNTPDWQKTACNICFVNCGLKVQLGGDDGRQIIKVKGDEDHIMSAGYVCNKAPRLNYYQNSPDRLLHPMRRCQDGSYEAISWDTAISEIAEKMATIRDTHGGERIFYYGGGAQGNHLGGTYFPPLKNALGIKYKGSGASQEKTGLTWVWGRTHGIYPHAEMEHAQVAMFVGKNPFMTNGIDRARNMLRDIRKDPTRTLIVIDPRRSETADYADIHLAVKPGRDAWCLSALLGYIVQNNLIDSGFLSEHTIGAEKVLKQLQTISVEKFAAFAGLPLQQIEQTARIIAEADSFALEEDLGVQMAPHSTLSSYLNALLYLLTGNFCKPGTVYPAKPLAEILTLDNLPIDENGYELERKRLPVTGGRVVSGQYCGNYLAEEILSDSPQRARGLIVESSNPVHSLAGAASLRKAIRSLDCSVAIDIAMTETARVCDYVLPAASTYEKWEATFFPFKYPKSVFHVRPPLMAPIADTTLPESEIHCRLVEALNVFEEGELDALHHAAKQGLDAYKQVFFEQLFSNRKIGKMISYVLFRTLGPVLPAGEEHTASLWGLCQMYAAKHPQDVARAGYTGEDPGTELYQALMSSPSGTVIGVSDPETAMQAVPHPDHKIQLVIGELLDELEEIKTLKPLVDTCEQFPFALIAGNRRAYTSNCLIRDPRWVKGKQAFEVTMLPLDAETQGLVEGQPVIIESATGKQKALLGFDERHHRGVVAVPNGMGMHFVDENGNQLDTGVYANELTCESHRDKFIGTPLHKFVPVKVSAA